MFNWSLPQELQRLTEGAYSTSSIYAFYYKSKTVKKGTNYKETKCWEVAYS